MGRQNNVGRERRSREKPAVKESLTVGRAQLNCAAICAEIERTKTWTCFVGIHRVGRCNARSYIGHLDGQEAAPTLRNSRMVGADTRGCLGSSVVSQGLTTDRTPEILLVRFPIKKHILIAFSPNVRGRTPLKNGPICFSSPPGGEFPSGLKVGASASKIRGVPGQPRGGDIPTLPRPTIFPSVHLQTWPFGPREVPGGIWRLVLP